MSETLKRMFKGMGLVDINPKSASQSFQKGVISAPPKKKKKKKKKKK